MTETPSFTAHNGFRLPAIGLGTYRMNGEASVVAGLSKSATCRRRPD